MIKKTVKKKKINWGWAGPSTIWQELGLAYYLVRTEELDELDEVLTELIHELLDNQLEKLLDKH